MIVLGNGNVKLKQYKNMINKPDDNNLTITDDLSIITLLYQSKSQIVEFLYCNDIDYKKETKDLINEISSITNNVYTTSYNNYKKISQKDNAIGLLAIFKIKPLELEDINKYNLVLVLDSLEIPGNIGTLYRTCEAINDVLVVLCDSVSKINNAKITASSRGANVYVPSVVSTFFLVSQYLLSNNYDIYLGEPNLGNSYELYNYENKCAIVIGNERFGINQKWYDYKHKKVFIPMNGLNNSLNVSVAGSILLFEAYTKRRSAKLKK